MSNPASAITDVIKNRRSTCDELRQTAVAGIRMDIADISVSLYIGKVDFIAEPADRIADELITSMYDRHLAMRCETAVRDWIVCGAGGIFITPFGPRALRPDEASWTGSIFEPEGSIREFKMSRVDAAKRFHRKLPNDNDTVTITEVYDGTDVTYYTGDFKLCTFKNWRYTPHWLFGLERPRLNSTLNTLPISVIERVAGLADAYDSTIYSIDQIGKRSGLAMVDSTMLKDPESAANIHERYEVVEVVNSEKGSAFNPVERQSINDLVGGFNILSNEITSRTGVNPYQRGIAAPSVDLATESIAIQSQSGVRSSYYGDRVARWLDLIIKDYRSYLCRLPSNEIEYAELVIDGEPITFGPATPYKNVLDGITIRLATVGYAEALQRRQETQGLIQMLNGAPGVNTQLLVKRLLRSYGLNPDEFVTEQLQQMPMQQPQAQPVQAQPAQ